MSQWDSNPQSQQASGHRPTSSTARPLGPALLYNYPDKVHKLIIIHNKGIRNTYSILVNLQLKYQSILELRINVRSKIGSCVLLSKYVAD